MNIQHGKARPLYHRGREAALGIAIGFAVAALVLAALWILVF